MLHRECSSYVHYANGYRLVTTFVDDTAGVAVSNAAAWRQLNDILSMYDAIGVPWKPDKVQVPRTHVLFLGVFVDLAAQVAYIPPVDKVRETAEQLGTCLRNGQSVR